MKKLYEPFQIHGVTLKNRVVMGSMHTGLEESWDGYRALAKFYEDRARGGVGLIITGGFSPCLRGRLTPFASELSSPFSVFLNKHRRVTEAVHRHGGKILLQILHSGRYSYHPFSEAPSALKSPITPFKPRAMSSRRTKKVVASFAESARLAQKAGYDGVELMGSEGYLLHQFWSARTNQRKDEWGGSRENRARFALETVRAVRKATSPEFLIFYRVPVLDLVENPAPWEDTVWFGSELLKSGASVLNSGIGWHESRVPTIATAVPRGAFLNLISKFKKDLTTLVGAQREVLVGACNRINAPDLAEKVVEENQADFVSMARPFLADAEWVNKAQSQAAASINTCIACNQACLDHIFTGKKASCMVNPRACREVETERTEEKIRESLVGKNVEKHSKTSIKKHRLAVVGAGPAGLSFAREAALLGHEVELFEKSDELGGQFKYAARVPGKEDFFETIRYFSQELQRLKVKTHLQKTFDPKVFSADAIIQTSGVRPRLTEFEKISGTTNPPKVWTYVEALTGQAPFQGKVAILGGGGIAVDVAEFVLRHGERKNEVERFQKFWGIEVSPPSFDPNPPRTSHAAEVTFLTRSDQRLAAHLGKTTAWIHRESLKKSGAARISGVSKIQLKDGGLLLTLADTTQKELECGDLIICIGQERQEFNFSQTGEKKMPVYRIGGAKDPQALDAKRAIYEGFWLAQQISDKGLTSDLQKRIDSL